jgi:hypothetical protein
MACNMVKMYCILKSRELFQKVLNPILSTNQNTAPQNYMIQTSAHINDPKEKAEIVIETCSKIISALKNSPECFGPLLLVFRKFLDFGKYKVTDKQTLKAIVHSFFYLRILNAIIVSIYPTGILKYLYFF